MGIYKWYASVIKEDERILCNFLWSGEPESRKLVLWLGISCVNHFRNGGINLRRLNEINQSLMMKLTWNFLNPKDEWSEFIQVKFIAKSGYFSMITKGSLIWEGVRGAIGDVRAYSGWVIGDGASIDLWRDSWCSPISLKDWINNDFIPWKDLHAKVSCIIVEVRWSIPYNLHLVFHRLGVDIYNIKINKNKTDRWVWQPDLVGKFSVKGAFESIRNKGQPACWYIFLFKKAIRPRLSRWDWRLRHGKIPSDDNDQTKGIAMASRCGLCNNSSETIQHLFWKCGFSIGEIWGGTNFLWQARNNCIFEEQINTLANEKRKWIKQIHDTAVLYSGFMFNNQSDLGILHCLGVAVQPCNHPMVKSFFWELPQKGEIKINIYGAARGNPGKGGIGCIFRDSDGKVFGTLSKGLGLVTNYMAKCEAIIHGVKYAALFGWLIAWNESDSTTAVEAFKSDNIP
ncbi:hypothetical protein GIB67_035358 [Kingdonia uniflora]|uniref:RNase H type-1 domain-containing protein n=1 Tax=Kingdonia uniflora TaxID=39325 RepID=A0A7J7NT29_9MAGN|nr:hypothetical protein GIB67_035358 [Kingdonia uniflora]